MSIRPGNYFPTSDLFPGLKSTGSSLCESPATTLIRTLPKGLLPLHVQVLQPSIARLNSKQFGWYQPGFTVVSKDPGSLPSFVLKKFSVFSLNVDIHVLVY